ncbi:MAG: GtrA family protein [Bacteroidales bacterium]|nr:GtrA family protein [Bacteroidales bacterium]
MSEYLSVAFLWKFIKFCIVGATGVVVDFGITYVCKEYIKIPKYISNAIGFTFATSTNYFFNRIWTFHSQDPEIFTEYFLFFFVSIVGLGINTLVLWFFVDKYKKNFYLSKLYAIGVASIWNFLANAFITFA